VRSGLTIPTYFQYKLRVFKAGAILENLTLEVFIQIGHRNKRCDILKSMSKEKKRDFMIQGYS
jgi:hypothetical protein